MKKILLIGAILGSTSLFAQSLVSTNPQNKKVVLEEFTGINCVYCPDGHAIAQSIKDQNPDDVFLVNIHTGGFADPGPGQPDFRTAFGTALENQAAVPGYPSGTVNRHIFSGNSSALNRGEWQAAANQILQQPSYVNVAGEAEIDVLTNELIVNVEVYYTGDSPESTNKLNVALLQDNTKGPQTGGNMGNEYNHMHRLVHFLTGQWGEDITSTTEGSFSEFTYTYEIPDDYRNIPAELEDLKLVVYVAEGNQEILTGDGIKPSYLNITSNDVAIKNIQDITPTCLGTITPAIEIQNRGAETLTSLEITYSVNGSDSEVYTWTGSLNTFETEIVELEEISFTPDNQINTIEVTIEEDDVEDNNSMTATFTPSIEGSNLSTLRIEAFATGPTTTWELKNIEGEVMYSGGPYDSFTIHNIDLELEDGCYAISIIDSDGLGRSKFTIKDEGGINLFESGSNYGESISGDFRTNSLLSVDDVTLETISLYPNPSNGIVNIDNAEGFHITVYDVLGKVITSKANISNQELIDLSNVTSGVYYMKLENEKTSTVKKVVIK